MIDFLDGPWGIGLFVVIMLTVAIAAISEDSDCYLDYEARVSAPIICD